MVSRTCVVAVAVGLLLTLVAQGWAVTLDPVAVTLNPVQDASLDQVNADTGYPTATGLPVYSQGAGAGIHSLLQFDVAGSGLTAAAVTEATLRLYIVGWEMTGDGSSHNLLRAYSTSMAWNETSNVPTWNTHQNKRSSNYYGSITTYGTESGWLEFDLDVVLIQGWLDGSIDNYGFFVRSDGYWKSWQPTFASREEADPAKRPELVIVPEPMAVTLLAVGALSALRRRR